MNENTTNRTQLIVMIAKRFLMMIILLSMMFFLSAGTLSYWEAWVYLTMITISMILVSRYLWKYAPKLLERRMRMQEKESVQRWIILISYIFIFLAFLLPGFDKRLGWSHIPICMILVADVCVVLGYVVIFLAFRENHYASRVIEVEQGQKVIQTGPYSVVRHPMYSGMCIMYFFSPFALGSYWAMLPMFILFWLLVARIQNEEAILSRELDGYKEYMQKTNYRLFPGIW